jgi:hypothetical protein
MTTYYAAAKWKEFLAEVRDGLRDLQSPSLAPFYAWAPEVSSAESAARLKASVDYREDNGLPVVGSPDFAFQVSKSSAKPVFVRIVSEMGVESEYVEDVVPEEQASKIPDIPGLQDVISRLIKAGFTVDTEALAAKFPGLDLSGGTIFHLNENEPTRWAEEDSVVLSKMARARKYVKMYQEGGVSA